MEIGILDIVRKYIEKEEKGFVALDLGQGYIKGLYLEESHIKKVFVEKNRGNAIEASSEWLRREGLLGRPVSVAIKGENTLIRYVPFTKVDKKNIKEAFSYEVSKFIPFNKDNIYFDVCVIDENYSKNEFLVLLAVVKKDFLDGLISNFQSQNVNVQNVNLSNVALINLFLHTSPPQDNVALVDVGAKSSLVTLIRKNIPCLSREGKVCANDLFAKVAKTKKIDIKEAENTIATLENPDEIIEIVEEIGVELAEEIKNSLDYFEVNWGRSIKRILLTGWLSSQGGIAKAMANTLGIETIVWDPVEYSGVSFEGDISPFKEMLAVSLGLSL